MYNLLAKYEYNACEHPEWHDNDANPVKMVINVMLKEAARKMAAHIEEEEEHVADLVKRVEEGFTDFDVAIATPDMMGAVGRLGRVLGPSGKMPNPKTGTVTFDVGKAVADVIGGKVEYRTDRAGIVHIGLGKKSFTAEQLTENYAAILDEILRAKPAATKGKYITSISIAQTMGPGIDIDPQYTQNLLEEATA